MCTMSMIMAHGINTIPTYERHPQPVRELLIRDFEALLQKAKEYDTLHGQPDCELNEKQRSLKAIADQLGVEIIFPSRIIPLGSTV